jgi:hypothetical protein
MSSRLLAISERELVSYEAARLQVLYQYQILAPGEKLLANTSSHASLLKPFTTEDLLTSLNKILASDT